MREEEDMPTRDTPWPNGTPCWIDYGAADLHAATAFYADLFGWEYTEGNEEDYGGYINALKGGHQVAGLGPQMGDADPPSWTTYFATDDSAGAVTRIKQAGGVVLVEPMEVAPYGTMTVALDPQGNPFGLWQAAEHTGVRVHNEPGALAWNEAAVDDPEAARAFYTAVFGFRFDEMPDSGGYTTFTTGDHPLGGLGGHQPGSPKGWTTCFSVANTDAAVSKVEAAGGKVTMAPMDTEFGRFAVLEDPWGAPFSVMQDPPA
jgi:predicted enzyme related to lactoylglutathione lyase